MQKVHIRESLSLHVHTRMCIVESNKGICTVKPQLSKYLSPPLLFSPLSPFLRLSKHPLCVCFFFSPFLFLPLFFPPLPPPFSLISFFLSLSLLHTLPRYTYNMQQQSRELPSPYTHTELDTVTTSKDDHSSPVKLLASCAHIQTHTHNLIKPLFKTHTDK